MSKPKNFKDFWQRKFWVSPWEPWVWERDVAINLYGLGFWALVHCNCGHRSCGWWRGWKLDWNLD